MDALYDYAAYGRLTTNYISALVNIPQMDENIVNLYFSNYLN